jgi:hypothetical protein
VVGGGRTGVISGIEDRAGRRPILRVFISYSSKGNTHCEKLDIFPEQFIRAGVNESWHDRVNAPRECSQRRHITLDVLSRDSAILNTRMLRG